MNVITPGHRYDLGSFEGTHRQILQFIHKETVLVPAHAAAQIQEPISELKTVMDGTTNEEVLRVLIDRMHFLNKAFPCRENSIVITKLEESLMWLEKRTLDRVARGVEGKQKA